MVSPHLRTEIVDSVALVTLSDPRRRNAITPGMRDELVACFDDLEASPDVVAVVLTGAGSSFCSGADLGDLGRASAGDFRRIYDAFLRVAASSLPTVAAVNGPAVGAGLNLALACDVRFAGTSSRFIVRFPDLGLHPGGGHSWMLRRAVGDQVAAAMLLFGEELEGERAEQRGLVYRCVEDDRLIAEALQFASRAGAAPQQLVARLKRTLSVLPRVSHLDEAVAIEFEAQVWSSQQEFFKERIAELRAPATPCS